MFTKNIYLYNCFYIVSYVSYHESAISIFYLIFIGKPLLFWWFLEYFTMQMKKLYIMWVSLITIILAGCSFKISRIPATTTPQKAPSIVRRIQVQTTNTTDIWSIANATGNEGMTSEQAAAIEKINAAIEKSKNQTK